MKPERSAHKVQGDIPCYSIGTVARMLGVSVPTLRMYEQAELMIPFKKSTHHRLFSDSDVDRLRCIRYAINEEKLSIAGIRKIYSFIPCWKLVGCSVSDQDHCQAFKGHSHHCWSYDHKKNICAKLECRDCEVYKISSDCNKIKSSIIAMKPGKPGNPR
jgi:MerR family transcriptional regulator, heat shock protein HspR